MNQIHILCVDDEPEVLEAVERSIAPLEKYFPIETADSADDARTVIREILDNGDRVGVILCDHIMPGENGVDLLIALSQEDSTADTRKVLLTGQAGLDATVLAVNQADLHHYIAKPWNTDDLVRTVKTQLTEYIIKAGIDPLPYMQSLDSAVINEAIRRGGLITDS